MTLVELIANHIFATLIFLVGVLLFAHAMKRNSVLAGGFVYNIFAGIIGGIVVAMFLDVKNQGGDGLDYLFITSGAMFFIGLMVFIMTPKRIKHNKSSK